MTVVQKKGNTCGFRQKVKGNVGLQKEMWVCKRKCGFCKRKCGFAKGKCGFWKGNVGVTVKKEMWVYGVKGNVGLQREMWVL